MKQPQLSINAGMEWGESDSRQTERYNEHPENALIKKVYPTMEN